jgi:hypothetical protein
MFQKIDNLEVPNDKSICKDMLCNHPAVRMLSLISRKEDKKKVSQVLAFLLHISLSHPKSLLTLWASQSEAMSRNVANLVSAMDLMGIRHPNQQPQES